jgi:transcriptional regulator of acetoin/glycerol metabolism
VGKLGAANGGTLFLDEIAEMPDALQAALLRVLDDGVYHRVGDNRPSRADFRLVCATCRDLPALVEQGAFRRDLFYRVHGGCVTIPSVRERDDRVFLARGLLARLAAPAPPLALTADAEAWIAEHDWPGNVRELKNALLHAVAMSAGEPLTRACFPRVLVARHGGGRGAVGPGAPLSARSRDDLLRDAVREAMRASQGNVTEAARRLGVARSTIYRSLRESAAS